MPRPVDFSLPALWEALDAQRDARGLDWTQAMAEIHLPLPTVMSLRTKTVAEADGVLQMLLWLDRTPESFLSDAYDAPLPAVAPGQILRVDTKKLHAALNTTREEKKIAWGTIARETGISVLQLMQLAKGGRTAFPFLTRLTRWLDAPVADFVHASDR